ncbi:MAG: hypothetical protein MUO58_05590 [Anaerolineales bacterium]|jgi:hypothetical protein|nr:hypothetical protein [Anaerolineales bacterium]
MPYELPVSPVCPTIESFDALADELKDILEKCNEEVMNLVPDAVPGFLMNKEDSK